MSTLERVKARMGYIVAGELEELVSEGHGALELVCKAYTGHRALVTVATLAARGVGEEIREVALTADTFAALG